MGLQHNFLAPSSGYHAVVVKTLEARRRQASHSKTETCSQTLIVTSFPPWSKGAQALLEALLACCVSTVSRLRRVQKVPSAMLILRLIAIHLPLPQRRLNSWTGRPHEGVMLMASSANSQHQPLWILQKVLQLSIVPGEVRLSFSDDSSCCQLRV